MRILVFTEGAIIAHHAALGRTRQEIVEQVERPDTSVRDYASYVPAGDAVRKLRTWRDQGASIFYLTSRTSEPEIGDVQRVLVSRLGGEGSGRCHPPGERVAHGSAQVQGLARLGPGSCPGLGVR